MRQFDGNAAMDFFGSAVTGAGDVDGDGFDDLVVGADGADPGGFQRAGSAYVYSGATGALLFQRDGTADGDFLGTSVSAVGDLDGDGLADVLIGASGAGGTGKALALSGPAGAILHEFVGITTGDRFGVSVSGAGDVDGDGFPDVIIGAMFAGIGGAAYLYSGTTWGLLQQFDGTSLNDKFGAAVSGTGDVDGDGVPDLVVGAWSADPAGLADAGSAYVYSGGTATLIFRLDGEAAGDNLGEAVAGAGDVDGDGFADLVIGAPQSSAGGILEAGAAYIYSGVSGHPLHRVYGSSPFGGLGDSVAGSPDVDSDGLAEVMVGAPRASSPGLFQNGAGTVLSIDPFLLFDASELSVASGATVQFELDFPASEAGARYAILASITGSGPTVVGGLAIPLTQDPVFMAIAGGNAPALFQGAYGTLSAVGDALASLTAGPALSPAIGHSVLFAAATYDVAPFSGRVSSIARYLTIVP